MLAGGCGPPGAARNVVLISVDTLRADFLGAYGNTWVKTPSIDALAAESVRFSRLIAPAPTTLASHTSLMTGRHPHTHGAASNGFVVADENVMLAEVLRDAGFRTAGIISGYPLESRFGFAQGFDDFIRIRSEREDEDESADLVTQEAIRWLQGSGEGRFFLFVHYWDVHWPYQPPPPYDRMYRTDDLPITGSKGDVLAVRRALRRQEDSAEERSDVMRRLYAGEVSWVDAQVGRLIDALREMDLLESTLLVLTSDHGESMDSHRVEFWNHGHTVYDTVVNVPLLVRMPGARLAGRVVDGLWSGIDVMPSLLELLELPVPPGVEGRSFAAAFDPEAEPPERGPVYSQATKPHTARFEKGRAWQNIDKCRAIWTPLWKLHHCPDVRLELYDARSDPEEMRNLLLRPNRTLERAAQRLIKQLADWSQEASPPETREDRSPEVEEQLRALGYLDD